MNSIGRQRRAKKSVRGLIRGLGLQIRVCGVAGRGGGPGPRRPGLDERRRPVVRIEPGEVGRQRRRLRVRRVERLVERRRRLVRVRRRAGLDDGLERAVGEQRVVVVGAVATADFRTPPRPPPPARRGRRRRRALGLVRREEVPWSSDASHETMQTKPQKGASSSGYWPAGAASALGPASGPMSSRAGVKKGWPFLLPALAPRSSVRLYLKGTARHGRRSNSFFFKTMARALSLRYFCGCA